MKFAKGKSKIELPFTTLPTQILVNQIKSELILGLNSYSTKCAARDQCNNRNQYSLFTSLLYS